VVLGRMTMMTMMMMVVGRGGAGQAFAKREPPCLVLCVVVWKQCRECEALECQQHRVLLVVSSIFEAISPRTDFSLVARSSSFMS